MPPRKNGSGSGNSVAAAAAEKGLALPVDALSGLFSEGFATVEDALKGILTSVPFRKIQKYGKLWSVVLEYTILAVICILAFIIRLFAVIRFESVIHEFDPYFNYRTTKFLTQEGFHEFWNWFDQGSWYPLGRVIGQTLYPGLMTTSAVLFKILHGFGFVVEIRNVCVFLAPTFAALTALAAYALGREVSGRSEAGLFSAIFMSICPSYMSRSVAGSYDNECVAIFALLFAFFRFVRAISTGSMMDTVWASLAYLYMVSTWGGYIFLTNTIAIYVFALIVLGRFNHKHYTVYVTWYILGTMMVLSIPFVNFGAIISSEHMSSHFVFLLANAVIASQAFAYFLAAVQDAKAWNTLLRKYPFLTYVLNPYYIIGAVALAFVMFFIFLTVTGKTQWAGRSMTLLDPTYASKYIPIIASVSEHQPTTWTNYIMDMQYVVFLSPIGMWYCFRKLSDESLFLGIYGILATYFSGVMIRLLLVLSPAACCLAGVGVSYVITAFTKALRCESGTTERRKAHSLVGSLVVLAVIFWSVFNYIKHGTSMSSMAYSSPSIVMSATARDGSRIIQDDFREAYYWMRKNTHPKATVASWWDYGYQITVMSNRTVIVDNNTWNNTHIATVGLALGSTEEQAFEILKKLDVDYFLVIFGGVAQYASDDINKFLWPVRIAQGVYPDKIAENDFIGMGGYTIDDSATDRMKSSLMYKLCYHRVAEITQGFDHVRRQKIGVPQQVLSHFKEEYTSENWIVRIYSLKDPQNREKFPRKKSKRRQELAELDDLDDE